MKLPCIMEQVLLYRIKWKRLKMQMSEFSWNNQQLVAKHHPFQLQIFYVHNMAGVFDFPWPVVYVYSLVLLDLCDAIELVLNISFVGRNLSGRTLNICIWSYRNLCYIDESFFTVWCMEYLCMRRSTIVTVFAGVLLIIRTITFFLINGSHKSLPPFLENKIPIHNKLNDCRCIYS